MTKSIHVLTAKQLSRLQDIYAGKGAEPEPASPATMSQQEQEAAGLKDAVPPRRSCPSGWVRIG